MPVRSLNSSVLVWPNRAEVDRAVRTWAAWSAEVHPEVVRVGYFGSYARGNWGVGSDLDLVVVVSTIEETWERRTGGWDLSRLPVPADLLVYSQAEWDRLTQDSNRFARVLTDEVVWVFLSG